jgi:hypothetical protein
MGDVFIEVEKISAIPARTADGTSVLNPITKKAIFEDYETKVEVISVSEIKSFREWKKSKSQQDAFKGGLMVIYFKSPNHRTKKDKSGVDRTANPEMIINESVDSFSKRLGAIRLPDGFEKANLG